MGGDRRRSRSRKDDKKRSRSRKEERRRKQKSPSKSDEDSDVTGKNNGEDMSAEARLALLEVENETLKAENASLRKKLVEALRKSGGSTSSAPKKEEKKSRKETSPKRKEKASSPKRKEASPARKRKAREEEPSMEREEDDGEMPAWAKEPDEDPNKPNAVLLVNPAMEIYNEPIANNIPLETRLPKVEEKMKKFLEHFGDNIQILDLKSGGVIIKDRKIFKMRYQCVFRESGAKLKVTTNKRFYFDASGPTATYCLDFEKHVDLVTPTPGTRPDGSLGCRPPREEHLVVLYEEKLGKITRIWVASDADKVGQDAMASEEILIKLPIYKQFEKKIAELKGGNAGEYFFNNYHNMPTVG